MRREVKQRLGDHAHAYVYAYKFIKVPKSRIRLLRAFTVTSQRNFRPHFSKVQDHSFHMSCHAGPYLPHSRRYTVNAKTILGVLVLLPSLRDIMLKPVKTPREISSRILERGKTKCSAGPAPWVRRRSSGFRAPQPRGWSDGLRTMWC